MGIWGRRSVLLAAHPLSAHALIAPLHPIGPHRPHCVLSSPHPRSKTTGRDGGRMADGERQTRKTRHSTRWIKQDARRDDGGEDNTEDEQATRRPTRRGNETGNTGRPLMRTNGRRRRRAIGAVPLFLASTQHERNKTEGDTFHHFARPPLPGSPSSVRLI